MPTTQGLKPRKSLKPFLGVSFSLVVASLLAPGNLNVWSSSQAAGWQRDLSNSVVDPLQTFSRETKIYKILDFTEELLETSITEVKIMEPLEKPFLLQESLKSSDELRKTGTPVMGEASLSFQGKYQSKNLEKKIPQIIEVTKKDLIEPTIEEDDVTKNSPDVDDPSKIAISRENYIEVPANRKGTIQEPLRILAVGDSLMLDLQYGLERVIGKREDVEIEGRGALGFGFTVPFWDWEEEVIADYDLMVATVRPDVIVVMLGANEFQGYQLNGEDLIPGSTRWTSVLTERAHDAISHWLAGGGKLYWWSTPSVSDPDFLITELNKVWNDVVLAWGEKAQIIDSMKILGNREGEFRWSIESIDGSLIPLRKKHGVHFYEIGADSLAHQLEDILFKDGWLGN